MATLGTFFGGTFLAMRGEKKKPAQAPPINASSKDEEAFIEYVINCRRRWLGRMRWVADVDCLQGVYEKRGG